LLQVVRNIEDPIGDRALFDRAPIDHWSMKHITLLGDAAHPMLPVQGQGANQAIQDGAALAEVLHGVDVNSLSEALQSYEARRKPIATFFQENFHQFPV
jgi:salicylate hydroxylase